VAGVWIRAGSSYIIHRLYCSCTYIFVTKIKMIFLKRSTVFISVVDPDPHVKTEDNVPAGMLKEKIRMFCASLKPLKKVV
jgi:hypothetical protein